MKRNRVGIVSIILGITLVIALLAVSRSDIAETDTGLADIVFSHESGFYDSAFDLQISGSGRQIRYTLDGSGPNADSLLYTGPIRIEDASPGANRYSMNTDVCIEMRGSLLEQAGITSRLGFKAPETPVDKATVVRAVAVDDFGNVSRVYNAVYFVGFDQKSEYDPVNIISIITDPENLFDHEYGIYVLGKTFDDTLVDGELVLPVEPNPGSWPANYKNKGIEWEREANICFFDTERNRVLSGDYGIRIQGGASRYMLPKSLNIYARERYGTGSIQADALFGEDWQLHSVNLNAGGQGLTTKIHDWLINTLVSDTCVLTREYEPYALFLDGEFWGLYWLTPRFKEDYFENKYGLSASDLIVTKTDHVEVGSREDIRLQQQLRQLICDNDMSDPEVFEQVCEQIDLDSWIDYYAIETYISNTDWPKNNTSAWRTRHTGSGEYEDGKWRWILFDVNLSMQLKYTATNTVKKTENRDAVLSSLNENPTFKERLGRRLVELAEDNFAPQRVSALIRRYEEQMKGIMGKEYARFRGDLTEEDFIQGCEDIITFFRERHDYILEQYNVQ